MILYRLEGEGDINRSLEVAIVTIESKSDKASSKITVTGQIKTTSVPRRCNTVSDKKASCT